MEGTNASFSYPPGLVLTGSSTAMCMGNGVWEPDPSQVRCIGKKYAYLPVFHVHEHCRLMRLYNICLSRQWDGYDSGLGLVAEDKPVAKAGGPEFNSR